MNWDIKMILESSLAALSTYGNYRKRHIIDMSRFIFWIFSNIQAPCTSNQTLKERQLTTANAIEIKVILRELCKQFIRT